MCGEEVLIPLAVDALTSGAQTVLQSQANNKVDDARSAAQAQENASLSKDRTNAMQSFGQSLETSGAPAVQQNQDANAASREATYDNAIYQPGLTGAQESGSGASKAAIVNALSQATARSKQIAQSKAIVDAYQDTNLNTQIAQQRASQNIGVQGNFAQGAGDLANYDMEVAPAAGAQDRQLAGIVGALGTVATAAAGKFAPAIAGSGPGYDPTTGVTWQAGRAAGNANLSPPVNYSYNPSTNSYLPSG